MKHTNNFISQILKITPILLLLSSCYSEMKVKVDVMDRYAILQSQVYKSLSEHKLNEIVYNDAFKGELKTIFKQQATEVQLEAVNKGLLDKDTSGFAMKSQRAADAVMETFTTEINNIKQELKSNKPVDVNQKLNKLLLGNNSGLFNEFKNQIADSLGLVKNPTEIKEITSKQEVAYKEQVTKIITQYGESIVNDPAASLIAMAPRKYWRRYGYKVDIIKDSLNEANRSGQASRMNKVTVRTFMGNSDIAVKMEAPGMFVVKGVRLDADAAVKASFKVLNQGIKYFAYANGIPVNSPAGSTENTGKIVILPEKAQNDSLRIAIENFGSIDKQDKVAFFNTVFSQLSILEPQKPKKPTEADVKQAISLIQNAYKVYITKQKNNTESVSK